MGRSERLTAALIALAVVPAAIIVNGWCISVLWAWFVVPLGAPPIGIAHSIGFACIVGFMTRQGDVAKSNKPLPQLAAEALLLGPVTLLFAAIPAWFMP